MKRLFFILILCWTCSSIAQNIWHVKPYGGNLDYSTTTNNGQTYDTAWTLHEALTNYHSTILPGDIVYLHGGTYQGHFVCTLTGNSWSANNFITIKSYPGEFATIDGHIYDGTYSIPGGMNITTIFQVDARYVQFENFRVTCLGDFTRLKDDQDLNCTGYEPSSSFHGYTGVRHDPSTSANFYPCRFINMVVDNIPGVGFASWKEIKDTEIYGCLMYYNGYLTSTRTSCGTPYDLLGSPGVPPNVQGSENCVYTQNRASNNAIRAYRNNIFANNYKSGIAVWSADTIPSFDYVSNYLIEKNVFINNGSPARDETANLYLASDSQNANNHVTNIDVTENVFYLNTSNYISGATTVNNHNVSFTYNDIYGGTAGVELTGSDTKMTWRNNLMVGKRIKVLATTTEFAGGLIPANAWDMDYNTYYTANPSGGGNNMFLTLSYPSGTTLSNFQSIFNAELNSQQYSQSDALHPIPSKNLILQNEYNPYRFHVIMYKPNTSSGNISFDFSSYGIPSGMHYVIYDAENYFDSTNVTTRVALDSGNFGGSNINFPVNSSPPFEMPRPAIASGKTSYISAPVHSLNNFRTFILELECEYPYDLVRANVSESTVIDYYAQNQIKFGSAYTATSTSNITATAGTEILFINDSYLLSDDQFLAKIDVVSCPEIDFSQARPVGNPKNSSSNVQPVKGSNELVSIYPNPNSGDFKVESLTDMTITKVIITHIDSAKKVFESSFKNEKSADINISKETPGLYTVQAYLSDGQIFTKNIIKK